jgi:CO dehydrogenase/acetyl-CoA synthase delta subunit
LAKEGYLQRVKMLLGDRYFNEQKANNYEYLTFDIFTRLQVSLQNNIEHKLNKVLKP